MPLPSLLLLRVLLSLSLVFNGSGFAVASGHMQMMAGQGATTADPATPGVASQHQAPCHEDGASAEAAVAHHAKAAHVASVAGDPATPNDGCCESGSCRCVCAIGAVAIIPPALNGISAAIAAAAIQPLRAGTPAPLLPHLIRPPIG